MTRSVSTSVVASALPKVAYGKGGYVTDTAGKTYVDGSGGPAVYSLGYGHPEVTEAIKAQLDTIMHGYRYTFTSDPLEELTAAILQGCGAPFAGVVMVSGGSEAMESCLKIALQYHAATGQMSRRRFISRQRSWHGNTLGVLALSGFAERRAPYEGALMPASLLSPVNAYRPPEGVSAHDVARHCAQELETEILSLGAENVAAFVFEPVVGAAGGVVPAPAGYAAMVRDICTRHGVLMIADEVMCGSGRCGTYRALAHDGVVPDIMAIAKGLSGGYVPLGAAIYSGDISEAITAAYGGAMTGHTFTGHTVACAAGAAIHRIFRRDGLIEHVATNSARLFDLLSDALSGIAEVGDLRGRGYFAGIELVADPFTKVPFPREMQLYLRVRERGMQNGLICYPSGGNVDGIVGDTIMIAPRYNAPDAELAEIADKLGQSVRQALADIGRG